MFVFVGVLLAFQHEVTEPLSNQSPLHVCVCSQVSGKGVQHHFDRWIEQLRVHRLYRQHEFAYGTRDAPRLTDVTSPVVEDFRSPLTSPGQNSPGEFTASIRLSLRTYSI